MFTPQRKGGWSFAPRSAERTRSLLSNPRSIGGTRFDKGKSVVDADVVQAPPQGLLGEDGTNAGGSNAEAEVWKRFAEAGMLDESMIEKKDREALLERIDKLEHELCDYQHNMGLLLIEKKEWACKTNKLQQGLVEAEEILKREKAAHMIAISEMEEREENLKTALGVEKQCVNELEKALREIRSEHAEVNIIADSKQAEAHAMGKELQDKMSEVDEKLRIADDQLVEINRKNSDVEMKVKELANRESILQREQQLLNNEKQLQAEVLARQREDLQSWEKSLREGQERLVDSQSLLLQREKNIMESDVALARKEKEIERLRESVEKGNSSLKEKENYLDTRLTALAAREKDIEIQMEALQKKKKDLHEKEHLNEKKMVEIEKIIDNYKTSLASKTQEVKVELEEKRKFVNNELNSKLVDVEKREIEIKLKEEKLLKGQKDLVEKIEQLKNDQNDLDVKGKALKTWEEALKQEEMELEKKNEQLSEDNGHLIISKAEIDAERECIKAERVKLFSEQETLQIKKWEREELAKLQSKLKKENDECMILKESYLKELEELREEKKNFEREWEILDEKRLALSTDERKVAVEKDVMKKWKCSEELRLNTDKQVARDEIQRELEDLRLKKEAFEASLAHDRSELLEKLQQERADMIQKLDIQKHEIEIDMQKKLQDLENQYQRKEKEFNERRMMEMDQIKSIRELAASEMQKLKIEQAGIEREKEEYLMQRRKLKDDQVEMQNDIEMLRSLSKTLKIQREAFMKERESFLSQNCNNCGVRAELAFHAILSSDEIGTPEDVPLPCLADGYLEDRLRAYQNDISSPVTNGSQFNASEGRLSWLKACTKKILNLSPRKRAKDSVDRPAEKLNILFCEPENETSNKVDEVAWSADLIGLSRTPQEAEEAVESPSTIHDVLENPIDGNGIENVENPSTTHDVLEKSIDGNGNEADNLSEMVSEHMISTLDGQNDSSSLSPLVGEVIESQVEPQGLKQNVKHGGRRGRSRALKRTHSVQAVVEESKVFLNDTHDKTGQDTSFKGDVSQEVSVHNGKSTSLSRKRHISEGAVSEMNADSETHSRSDSLGGCRKRQLVPDSQAGEKRYNFRRTTTEGKGGASQSAMRTTKAAKARKPPQPLAKRRSRDNSDEREGILKHVPTDSPVAIAQDNDVNVHTSQRSVDNSIVVHESTLKIVEEATIQTGNDTAYSGDESASISAGRGDDVYETVGGAASDVDDKDESDNERRDASIGKKLWKFFTS